MIRCIHPTYRWMLVDSKGKSCPKTTKPVFKQWTQVPCAQQRCPVVKCRQKWARNQASKLAKSFETLPPTHFLVLKHDFNSQDEVWACFKRFRSLLKYKLKDNKLEYYITIEQEYPDPPHIHLLIRTAVDLTKDLVRPLWVKACVNNDVVVYCEIVRNAVNCAKYLPKYWFYKINPGCVERHVPWLPGPEWHDISLNYPSRHFLSHSWAELWEMVKKDWFSEPEEDLNDVPIFKPSALPLNNITDRMKKDQNNTTDRMTEGYSYEDFLTDLYSIDNPDERSLL